MSKITAYNLKHLVQVKACKEKESQLFFYKKEVKFLGLTLRRGGFYNLMDRLIDINEMSDEGYFVRDKVFFLSPRVVLNFSNDYELVIPCSTIVEAQNIALRLSKAQEVKAEEMLASGWYRKGDFLIKER